MVRKTNFLGYHLGFLSRLAYCFFRAAVPGLDPASSNSNSESVRKLRELMNLVQEIKVL